MSMIESLQVMLAAGRQGDMRAVREMQVFLRRIEPALADSD